MEVELYGDRHELTDAEWELLRPVLPTGRRGPVRKNDRRIMDGIFFILRTGSPWRDLPERYGPYTTCYNRWSKDGSWARIISKLQPVAGSDGDGGDGSAAGLGERMIDSSAVRMHRHGSGSRRNGEPRETGRSRGGLTTKIHAAVDGAGRSLTVRLSPGQAADCTQAPTLLVSLEAGVRVIADKVYDRYLEPVAEAGGISVIASTANRKVPRELDRDLYARRNRVERFFGKIKKFRRVAPRYEKRASNDLSTVLLAETRDLMRTLARQSTESTP